MLANQLSVLLAQRQLSIKQVVKEIGISRSSISNIVNNPSANISTDTINKLCSYLGITPADFFIYTPYDFEFTYGKESSEWSITVTSTYKRTETIFDYEVFGTIYDRNHDGDPVPGNYDIYITMSDGKVRDSSLLPVYEKLPINFQSQLNLILEDILKSIFTDYSDIFMVQTEIDGLKVSALSRVIKSLKKGTIKVAIDLPWIRLKKTYNATKKTF